MSTDGVLQHTSRRYDEDLERVRSKVLKMGGLVEHQLQRILQALVNADQALGRAVASEDSIVNGMELSIDEDCTRILATRSPTACDLRLVVAIIKVTADLERIGDECQKLGYISAKLATLARPPDRYSEVERLGQQVKALLHGALDALARLSAESALENARKDRAIDELHDVLQRRSVAQITSHPHDAERLLETIWLVRALERIGDHAKNICEYVIFMVRGKDVRHISLDQVG